MPYASNQGIRIHYQTEGEGPSLVLHHWSLTTLQGWYDYGYVSALRDDYQLILLDARGHGASDKPHEPEAYELKNRVDDIVAVLDALSITQADFFGYSMGGWIGFGVARYVPERFRSLIIGGQHPYAQNMDGLRQLIRIGIEKGPEAVVVAWEESFGRLLSENKDRMLSYDYEALLAVAQDRESLETVLPTMKMPCLLYVGEMDEIYPLVNKCANQIDDVTLVTLPGLNHGQAIERSDEVVPHIKKFLSAVTQQIGTA